ncbi:MAG: type IV pilus modification protein PilV [Halioglobus sp.]
MYCHIRSTVAGSSLIEVMIATLLFSVAVLGLGAAQLAAKNNLEIAQQRSVATLLGRDMVEKMQANPGQLTRYAEAAEQPPAAEAVPDCVTGSCSNAELALYDTHEWWQLLSGPAQEDVGEASPNRLGGLVSPWACIELDEQMLRLVLVWWGRQSLPNPGDSDCGENTGLYGLQNSHRRVMVLSSFIGGGWG